MYNFFYFCVRARKTIEIFNFNRISLELTPGIPRVSLANAKKDLSRSVRLVGARCVIPYKVGGDTTASELWNGESGSDPDVLGDTERMRYGPHGQLLFSKQQRCLV